MTARHPSDEQPPAGWTLRATGVVPCMPWPRYVMSRPEWENVAAALTEGSIILLALWADTLQVHALLLDETTLTPIAVSIAVEDGLYPALSAACPAAALFERMIHDLWGHAPDAAGDLRPWLDHGQWELSKPLAVRPGPPLRPHDPPAPPASDRHPLMQLPLGPTWGRIGEAAQLQLTLDGPDVVAATSQLGFAHKGTLALVRGKAPRAAARFAARLSADATVAHSIAFAAAVEAALGVAPPPRAIALRTAMLEIERIAGHLDSLAEVGRLAEARPVQTRCAFLREALLRTSAAVFGHRLMMDCVAPGGLATDMAEGGRELILRTLGDISSQLPALHQLHGGTRLVARLNGVGLVGQALARSLGAGGIVGRASGRSFDARALTGGCGGLATRSATRRDGDAAARQHLRIEEIEQSLRLVSAAMDALPAGPLAAALPQVSGEGIGCAESVRGDVWHWIRLDHGQVASFFPRDPGWALWPLAERSLEGAAVGDVDLIRASFALPASAMDL